MSGRINPLPANQRPRWPILQPPEERDLVERATAEAQRILADEHHVAVATGSAMTLEEAVEYALRAE